MPSWAGESLTGLRWPTQDKLVLVPGLREGYPSLTLTGGQAGLGLPPQPLSDRGHQVRALSPHRLPRAGEEAPSRRVVTSPASPTPPAGHRDPGTQEGLPQPPLQSRTFQGSSLSREQAIFSRLSTAVSCLRSASALGPTLFSAFSSCGE